jgi:hypothetical protein
MPTLSICAHLLVRLPGLYTSADEFDMSLPIFEFATGDPVKLRAEIAITSLATLFGRQFFLFG